MATLATRLARAERVTGSPRAVWRAYLSQCFTGPQYEGHREAIVEALCSDMPQYTFMRDSDPAYGGRAAFYSVTWWTRDQGGDAAAGAVPLSRVVVLEGRADTLGAVAGAWPPAVRTYPGAWGAVLGADEGGTSDPGE